MKYDKDSYVVIPNKKTLKGEASTVQSVYFWICDHADAGGQCWPSIKTLALEAGCSERTVDASVKRLVELGILTKNNRFKDNEQQTNIYQINLISAPPSATIAPPLAQPLRTELNPILIQSNTSELEIRVVPEEKETEPRSKTKPKYPNARTAFSWFPRVEPSWGLNTTELKHGELLFLRGERQVKIALRFVAEHKGEEYFPTVTKPSDLERKWKDIVAKQKTV